MVLCDSLLIWPFHVGLFLQGRLSSAAAAFRHSHEQITAEVCLVTSEIALIFGVLTVRPFTDRCSL